MSIDGVDIFDEDFAAVTEETKAAVDTFLKNGGEQPTQFEVITAMAFLYFAKEKVDYAVIEVGMGGLWDSTNVIVPELSVITNVTLEHTDRLGKTIEAIAEQKAGIIKDHVPVVTAADGSALEVIRVTSEENRHLFMSMVRIFPQPCLLDPCRNSSSSIRFIPVSGKLPSILPAPIRS